MTLRYDSKPAARHRVLVAGLQLLISVGYLVLAITEPDAARGALVITLYALTMTLSWCYQRRHRA